MLPTWGSPVGLGANRVRTGPGRLSGMRGPLFVLELFVLVVDHVAHGPPRPALLLALTLLGALLVERPEARLRGTLAEEALSREGAGKLGAARAADDVQLGEEHDEMDPVRMGFQEAL